MQYDFEVQRMVPAVAKWVFLAFIFLSFKGTPPPQRLTESETARTIVDKVLKAIDNVKTLKYYLKATERIKGKLMYFESHVKIQKSPRKLYLFTKGAELLWVQGENNGNALVNPGSFPFFTLSLDPYNSLLRKNQHHTIHEIGYEYMGDIVKHFMKQAGSHFDDYFLYLGEERWNNRPCYKLLINNLNYTFEEYTVKKGENLVSIARKLKLSEYMILENNPQLSDYNDVKEGSKIKIPNMYAKSTLLYIDKQYFVPINNKIYDDKGLFEAYEYHHMQVNPKIAEEEFTRDYKDYNF